MQGGGPAVFPGYYSAEAPAVATAPPAGPTLTPTITPTPTPDPDLLFMDGFETGDTSAWSATSGG